VFAFVVWAEGCPRAVGCLDTDKQISAGKGWQGTMRRGAVQ